MQRAAFVLVGVLMVSFEGSAEATQKPEKLRFQAQAPVLSAEKSEWRVPDGYAWAPVFFRLSRPQGHTVNLRACQNASLERDAEYGFLRCGRYEAGWPGAFHPAGATRAEARLPAGRYEVLASPICSGNECGLESNRVRVTVTDECGWVGVKGQPPARSSRVPVLLGAPYPCNGVLDGPAELRSPGGGSFVLASGVAEWISIWKDRRDRIPNIELELGLTRAAPGRPSVPVRARLRPGTPLIRHVIGTQTAAVLVVIRGRSDVEISHGSGRTRVHVYRGQAALVPTPADYPSRRFHLPSYVHGRCRGRPLMPCLARVRIRRGYGTRNERFERTVILRTGQTRVVRTRGR